jgi:hypothetical protein
VVLDVLIRKHKAIRTSLGISVPVPADTETVLAALMHGSLLKGGVDQLALDFAQAERDELHGEWQAAADREKLSRTMFAQQAIKTEEVAQELEAIRRSIGSGVDVEWFVREVLAGHGARITETRAPSPKPSPPQSLAPKGGEGTGEGGRAALDSDSGIVSVSLAEVPRAVRDAIKDYRDLEEFQARFALPVAEGVFYLHRTHPVVEGLAGYVIDCALDPLLAGKGIARRAGVIRTRAVSRRTTAVLIRLRYHIVTRRRSDEGALLAEDWQLAAFAGSPAAPEWLPEEQAEVLLQARPDANIAADIARPHLERVLGELPALEGHFGEMARKRGEILLEAHRRVRKALRMTGVTQHVEPKLPADILGVYVYLPAE